MTELHGMAQGRASCPLSPNKNKTEALLLIHEEGSHLHCLSAHTHISLLFEVQFASYQLGYLWQVTKLSESQVCHAIGEIDGGHCWGKLDGLRIP